MKKAVIMAALAAVLGFGLCGNILLSAMAKEAAGEEHTAYYTSIPIREGDTLWSVAGEYAPGMGMEIPDYVECLRRMNGLSGDTIHAGRYLTVMYDGAAEE